MSEVLYRRLKYFISPQYDIYKSIADQVVPGEKILDIGFGTGFGSLYVANKAGAHVTGVELDADAVRFAIDCLPGVNWQWGDISRGVSYIGSGYDTALMIEVLEHVSEWTIALLNVAEVLKPGGRLIISARNANADLRKNDLHEREWTAGQLVDALGKFFPSVELYDYTLTQKMDKDTRQTPLVAVARKEHDA